jgi:hypothetical protein
MSRIESIMLKLKRVGFPLAALVLFIATADGAAALMHASPWDAVRWSLAVLFAAVLDTVLIGTVLDWQKTRSFLAFLFMLIFMAASGLASTNLWYRFMRGAEKTVELFELQRDPVLGELIALHDRVNDAVTGLAQLSTNSNSLADREVKEGNTCGIAAKIPGPRQRFRKRDADFFAGLQSDLSLIPPRLKAEIEAIRALRPVPGETVAADAGRLRLALSNAASVLRDPAIPRIADELRKRINEDGVDRWEGRTKFNCADPSIKIQAGNALARIEKLPALNIQVTVPDFTKPSEGLRIIPLLLDFRSWGQKGGMSAVDATAVFFAMLLELALFWAARGFARDMRPERVLERLPAQLELVPDDALEFVRTLTGEPDSRVRELCRLLQRYQTRIGFSDRLVVSHGCKDKRVDDLAWYVPALVQTGWLAHDRWVFLPFVNAVGWWKWPETRGCDRRETFRIERNVFDELHLAEVIARMRERKQPPPPQPDSNWRPRIAA